MLPNVPTIALFCLNPKILEFQPSLPESVIVTVRRKVAGQPPKGQKVEKIVVALNVVPLVL